MRTRIALGFGGLILAALATPFLLLRPASANPVVTLRFTGYSQDGKALFAITNNTIHWVTGGFPHIEYLTPAGWTNYYNTDESLIGGHAPDLYPGDGWCIDRILPAGQVTWRAALYYQTYPNDRLSLDRRTLDSVLSYIGAGTKQKQQNVANQLQVVRTEARTR